MTLGSLLYMRCRYRSLCGRIHRSPTENSAPDFSTIQFGGLDLWLRVGILGSVDPNRYPYPNPNNNPNANPTLTLIVTLTWL